VVKCSVGYLQAVMAYFLIYTVNNERA